MNAVVINFFKELLMRLSVQSPLFFQVIKVFTGLLTGANYIPSIMQRWFKIDMPEHLISICEDIALVSIGIFAGSFLPADTKPVAVTTSGAILKTTDEKKLPFTAQHEEKQMQKTGAKESLAEVDCTVVKEPQE